MFMTKKTGWQAIDENQTFIFNIAGDPEVGEDFTMQVTIVENGETVIRHLPVGEYTVSEVTDWSWRYSATGKQGESETVTYILRNTAPTNEVKVKLTTPLQREVVEFANDRQKVKWLDGNAATKKNIFGTIAPSATPSPETSAEVTGTYTLKTPAPQTQSDEDDPDFIQ